jgi:hypothetical protein
MAAAAYLYDARSRKHPRAYLQVVFRDEDVQNNARFVWASSVLLLASHGIQV